MVVVLHVISQMHNCFIFIHPELVCVFLFFFACYWENCFTVVFSTFVKPTIVQSKLLRNYNLNWCITYIFSYIDPYAVARSHWKICNLYRLLFVFLVFVEQLTRKNLRLDISRNWCNTMAAVRCVRYCGVCLWLSFFAVAV